MDQLLGLNGHPDPVAAAVAVLKRGCGLHGLDAEDLRQECRLRILSKCCTPARDPFAWAFTVATRFALDLIAKEKTRLKRVGGGPLPRQLIDYRDAGSDFGPILDLLPAQDRRDLEAHIITGLEPEVIALVRGCTAEEVRASLLRSVKRLTAAIAA
jgi:DNA-directed RNA polymerase specialized sigma24 family protein